MITRAQLVARAARKVGAASGDISSGTANSAILSGQINTTGDDNLHRGDILFMLDAANEVDKERLIDIWRDAEGEARWTTARSDTTYTSETFIISQKEDYTLKEYRDALNVALRETKRSYRWPVPLAPNQRIIPLSDLTWLMGAGDLDKVMRSDNPNIVRNAEFSEWSSGFTTVPDGWTLTGASAAVERQTTGIRSGYSARVTRSAATTTLTQTIPLQLLEYLVRSPASLSTMAIGAWVTTSTASNAKVGVNATFSGFHTGGGYPEWLTTTFTPAITNTAITVTLQLDVNASVADWHGVYLIIGDAVPDVLKQAGDQGYRDYEVNHRVRNTGGAPVVQLMSETSGQVVLYTRRGWEPLTADSAQMDDQYARALEAGLLSKLLEVRKPNQDRTRLDAILDEERLIWTRLTNNFVDIPVPDEPMQISIVGA